MEHGQTEFNLEEYILHHMTNSHNWHPPLLPNVKLPEWLSLHASAFLFCSFLLVIIFCVLYDRKRSVPSGLTNFLETLVLFIRDQVATPALGKESGKKFTPFLCTLFFLILLINLSGLIPIIPTATSNINITAGLALVTFTIMVFGAIKKHGIKHFFQSLAPSGLPAPILFLLYPLEFLGLFIKAFALTIRLFANMFAGHIVILSILGLVVMIGVVGLPMIFLALFISVLEVLIAFLQAYIFTLLSAIFIGQTYHPQH